MAAIVVDIDGTLLSESGVPNDPLIEILNRKASSGDEIIVVSARNISTMEETKKELDDAGLDYSDIHLNDFPGPAIATGDAFKEYKVKRLQREGKKIEDGIDNSAAVRRIYDGLGVNAWSPSEYVAANSSRSNRAIDPNGYQPTSEMKKEADQALEWRRVFGRGGTLVGVARARDISSGKRLPFETVRRMSSYFARHEVDKEAQGFNRGEDGYPSAGRIAWGLWGGDSGRAWSSRIIEQVAAEDAARSVEVEMGIEFRTARMELRAVDGTGMEFEGYAALYDSPSADGTTPEVVKETAFNRSLAAVERGEWDVRAYQDHDPKLLLGTTKSGTLSLKSDGKGLLAKIKLNPEISFHRDLAAIVKTMGNSLGMSFGFWNTNANRVNDEGVRELRDVKLVEVSALTGLAPYYPGTISLVSVRGLAQKAGVDSSDLRDAVAALLAGEATQDHATILAAAIAASSRDVEGVPTKFPGDESKDDKKEKVEEDKAPVDDEKRSVIEDLGIAVEDLSAAVDALVAGNASQDQIDLIAQVAKAEIADAQDAPDAAPMDAAPMDAAPMAEEDQNTVEIDIEITLPRSVPRTLREKELDLRRHAVK